MNRLDPSTSRQQPNSNDSSLPKLKTPSFLPQLPLLDAKLLIELSFGITSRAGLSLHLLASQASALIFYNLLDASLLGMRPQKNRTLTGQFLLHSLKTLPVAP